MHCSRTICPKFSLFSSANDDVFLPNSTFDMCDYSSALGRKQCKTIFVTEECTCKQERAAEWVGYSCLKIVHRVVDGQPWLTASAKSFSFPGTCLTSILIPKCFWPMASSLVSPLAYLLELKNFFAQRFADLLSPPQCYSGCQGTCRCPASIAAATVNKFTTIAANSNSLIHSFPLVFLSWWILPSISLWSSFQWSCHQ